ncbi:MAG: family NAD(P)-dependent oxidoreductase [Nevskia sp.]|nr:family NAD(P)-dependent oxidoreductase [Nevskia sp.]
MARNVLITGGNSGIGLEMARELAGRGDRVLIVARDQAKSQAAIADIKVTHPNAQIETLALDLGDFANIDQFAAALLARMPLIDVLILNAGLFTMPLHKLPSGYEAMIGVMHFGHFRLVQRILDAVKAAAQGRIVVTSSLMHKFGRIDQASFTDPKRHRFGILAYGQAKLANLIFTRELARRLAGTRITVNAFHPGAVATGIYRETPSLPRRVALAFMLSPQKGADTAIWLATAPEAAKFNGEYFVKRKIAASTAMSRDIGLAKQLWDLSEQASVI